MLYKRIIVCLGLALIFFSSSYAQVNAVEFGKNRIQYKKMKWKFYEGQNFNTYVNQGGTELGSFVSQMAEGELPDVEALMENNLRNKASIFVYNSYDEVIQLVSQLSPMYRLIFNMYIIDGMTHDDIAKELNISVGTSKSNLSKARVNMIKLIENKQKAVV